MVSSPDLQYACENGIIDFADVQKKIEMKKRNDLLAMHPYKISQGSDGNWYTYLPDETGGRKKRKRSSQKGIEDVVVEYWKQHEENPTIKEVFTEWNDRRLQLKKISKATHLRNKQVFNRHYSEFGSRRIKSVSPEDFEEFLEEQIPEHNLTSKAFSNLKTITRGFLKRAKKRKLISYTVEEIFNELDTSDTNYKKVIKEDYEEVFNDEEMGKMIDYLTKNMDTKNIGILLMFASGIRVGELVALKHSDFDGVSFKIRRTETRYVDENGKYVYEIKEFPKSEAGIRKPCLTEGYQWLSEVVKSLNPSGEYIFTNESGERLTTQAVRMRLKRLCIKLKIYPKSPHKIRKNYGSILLDNNVDQSIIIEQMGHTNITTTEKYYHKNRKTLEKKLQILNEIPELQARRPTVEAS